jgi:hypothetical protein
MLGGRTSERDVEAALHPLDGHLQVQLADARDDGLARLLILRVVQGGILLAQPGQGDGQLDLLALLLGRHRQRDHRLRIGERHRLVVRLEVRAVQDLIDVELVDLADGDDVPRVGHRLDLGVVAPLDLEDVAGAKGAPLLAADEGRLASRLPCRRRIDDSLPR